MLGLIAAYAVGRSRGRRQCERDALRYDPEYQAYEAGVVFGIVILLVAWPIACAIWLWQATRNWWRAIGVPVGAALIGVAFIPLWVLGALVSIGIWLTRLQAADERRAWQEAIDEEIAFERALEQRRRELREE